MQLAVVVQTRQLSMHCLHRLTNLNEPGTHLKQVPSGIKILELSHMQASFVRVMLGGHKGSLEEELFEEDVAIVMLGNVVMFVGEVAHNISLLLFSI
jgi:hypothetical protein